MLFTSLSPCTVKCFFKEALSVNILPQASSWQVNIRGILFFIFLDGPPKLRFTYLKTRDLF